MPRGGLPLDPPRRYLFNQAPYPRAHPGVDRYHALDSDSSPSAQKKVSV